MTFEEALKLVEEKASVYWGTYRVENLVNDLQETYAPKIKMTSEQKEEFMTFEEAIELIEDECRVEAEDGFSTKEKEPLYALEFPKQLNTFVAYTVKNQDNEVIISGYTSIKKGAKRFTEQEIKEIDHRYWAFAVKVDEV